MLLDLRGGLGALLLCDGYEVKRDLAEVTLVEVSGLVDYRPGRDPLLGSDGLERGGGASRGSTGLRPGSSLHDAARGRPVAPKWIAVGYQEPRRIET